MPNAVPYEKFVRLQLLLGEPFSSIVEVARAAGVPVVSLARLGELKAELTDSLPDILGKEVINSGFSIDVLLAHSEALAGAGWGDVDTLGLFMANPEDFHVALEYFATPELRVRADALVLSGLCKPDEISESLRGWSKTRCTPAAVNLFAFYFCNVQAMGSFRNWQAYIDEFKDSSQRWYLSRAYDVQTIGDLALLMDDLSVRSAIKLTVEDTVNDLLRDAFIQTKREGRKIAEGVPAKSTAVFEWASMYCSMFDRAGRVMDELNKTDAVERVRAKLVSIKSQEPKKLKDYPLAIAGE